jgi:hypothetical protein
MQHRAPCPDDPADLSTAWASKLHRIPLSAPHCRFLRLFVVSDNSAQRENVPKATLARRSGFALIASSLPQSGRHVAVLAGQAAAASAFRDETTMPAPRGHFFGRERKAPRDAPHCIRGALRGPPGRCPRPRRADDGRGGLRDRYRPRFEAGSAARCFPCASQSSLRKVGWR